MGRAITGKTLENAAMKVLFLVMKGKLEGRDGLLRMKAAIAVLQAQKKLGGSRASPVPEDGVTGEEEAEVPELKGLSDKELEELMKD